jgi:capsular polysaccharide export protein
VLTSFDHRDNIILFAFRKSHKVFFENIIAKCDSKKIRILSTKSSWSLSLKAFSQFKYINTDGACDFAIAEFYAKTNLSIPKFLLKIYFKTFAYINFMRYYAALDDQCEKMLLWNGGKFRQRIALEVAKLKEIQVYYFENGLLPNTIVFDNQGINYENSVPRALSFFKTYTSEIDLPKELVPRIGKGNQKFVGEKEDLPTKFIFVPFQVDYDTQVISHSHWIKNMRMLFDVIENVSVNSAYHFVLKEHPSSGVKYSDLYTRADHMTNVSFKNTYSTQELIEKSLAVITINSTVGIESLLFHKKVIVLGDAFYNIEGITYPASDQISLVALLDSIEGLNIDAKHIDNFLKYLYNDYLIPKNDKMYMTMCQRLLEKNVSEVKQ